MKTVSCLTIVSQDALGNIMGQCGVPQGNGAARGNRDWNDNDKNARDTNVQKINLHT